MLCEKRPQQPVRPVAWQPCAATNCRSHSQNSRIDPPQSLRDQTDHGAIGSGNRGPRKPFAEPAMPLSPGQPPGNTTGNNHAPTGPIFRVPLPSDKPGSDVSEPLRRAVLPNPGRTPKTGASEKRFGRHPAHHNPDLSGPVPKNLGCSHSGGHRQAVSRPAWRHPSPGIAAHKIRTF